MSTRSFSLMAAACAALLAGCGSSTSTGTNPTPTAQGQALNHVHSILVWPTDPNHLLVGMHYHLYRSMNGGQTFSAVMKQMLLSMAFDPHNPTIIYGVSQQRGPIRSTDGGSHWSPIPGLKSGAITGMYSDPVSGTVYAYGLGVQRSTDGSHWVRSLKGQSVHQIAAGSNGSIYAASDNGLEVSLDGGSHWATSAAIGNQPVIGVAASGAMGYALGAIGVFRTSDGGHTWHQLNKAPQGVIFLAVDPSNSNHVLGEVAQRGFYASEDGGATWRRSNTGIHSSNFNASTVRFAPSKPATVYTAAWGVHFYASHDGGHTWKQTSYIAR